MKKVWIRGDKERGSEVIKTLEKLGGVNRHNYQCDSPETFYFIDCYGDISFTIDKREKTLIMWSGEELKLPEQKPEPKFKIGDVVKIKDNGLTYTITDIIEDTNTIEYILNNNRAWAYEEELIFANILKRLDPVMCSDMGKEWTSRLYRNNNTVYTYIGDDNNSFVYYKYIVPLSDFDFKDLKSNIKKSVI